VDLEDGSSFALTFFTVRNVRLLLDRYRETGECASGTFLWAKNMIIVDEISQSVLEKSIRELINTGELDSCAQKIA
jgi:hypothetical protein